MRIIYMHQYFTTPREAGGTRSYEMGRRLVAAGHEVEMIAADCGVDRVRLNWSVETEAGMTVHRIGIPYSNRLGYVQRVWAFIVFAVAATLRAVHVKGDVIYASSTPLTIAIPARLAAALLRIPYVFEVRDLWPRVPIAMGVLRNPVLIAVARLLERWAYSGAAHIVALAPGMAEHVNTVTHGAKSVTVIPNGCDCELFRDDEGARRIRTRYEWLGDRKLVLYAGTLGLVNGVDWLVEVARVVIDLDSSIRFVIIGDGRAADQVRQRAEDLGILGQNLYLLGLMPKDKVAHWVRACDVVASLTMDRPYLWENAVANKFFDALAAARPVVINHGGYQSDVALEAGAGVTLDPHNHEAAALRLVELLRDDAWLRTAGRASGDLGEGEFNRDGLADRLLAVLEAVVRGT